MKYNTFDIEIDNDVIYIRVKKESNIYLIYDNEGYLKLINVVNK